MSSFITNYQCDQKMDSKNLFGEVGTLDPINRRLQSKQLDTLPNFILCTTAFPYFYKNNNLITVHCHIP